MTNKTRSRIVVAVFAVAAAVTLIAVRGQLIDWFTGGSAQRPSPQVSPTTEGSAGTAKPADASLPAFELPARALDAVRHAFDGTERARAELVADRLDGVAAPAREVAGALRAARAAVEPAPPVIVDAVERALAASEQLAADTDLAAARRSFGELNRFLLGLAGADPRLQDGWNVFRCTMADGYEKWLQRSPTLENPYMGQSMPSCGTGATWSPVPPGETAAEISHEGHGHAGSDIAFYTCSMHPAVRQSEPGKCPICGMELSSVTFDEEESGVIRLDEASRDTLGVRAEPIARAPMARALRAAGRVAYDESRLEDVTLKLGGYITKLHVTETGQAVKKGQLLFALYSPELFAAQQEYLLARVSHEQAGSGRGEYLVRAAAKKLELWGMSRAQLDALANRGTPLEDVPFYAPASGYVIEKNVVDGAAVKPGDRLFRIAALDRVWVEADLYEADLGLIAKGQRATVSLSYLPGKSFDGKVAYVYPYLDPGARTGRVRVELPNRGLELKPDMYATVAFEIDLGSRLQIPISAVVYTGPRRLVFVDIGEGRLRPQEVTLGVRNEDTVEVISGLREGQRIVTSGNFLIAAESRIRSSARFWAEERDGSSAPPQGASQRAPIDPHAGHR